MPLLKTHTHAQQLALSAADLFGVEYLPDFELGRIVVLQDVLKTEVDHGPDSVGLFLIVLRHYYPV